MKKIFTLLVFLTVCLGGRSQTNDCSALLNHFLIVVDSNTYQAILNAEVLNSDFAYAYERNKNWEGIYVIGQDNYIEIFHPKSMPNEDIPIGFSWICQVSLVANCIENYELSDYEMIEYDSDEYFDYLSVYTKDSSNLMTTQEMNKNQYESWTKKSFNDSLIFQTIDYNSPAESDSSKNYLFHNVTGIQVDLNIKDSLNIVQYLNLIGYTVENKKENNLKFSNANDFIDLHFSKDLEFSSISVIYFELSESTKSKRMRLGNSEIVIVGDKGKWVVNK